MDFLSRKPGGLSNIVKRKRIRSGRVGHMPICLSPLCWSDCHSGRGLTAALSDAFEARNGLFDRRPVVRKNNTQFELCRGPRMVGVDNESNQVSKGHSVDALALRGDEGRGTLR